jgi:hypothetical protein
MEGHNVQAPVRCSRQAAWAFTLISALMALSGCGSIEVALGLRMRLDKVPVSSVTATLSPDPGLAPGQSGRLILAASTADGKTYVTAGAGHGKVLFDSYTLTSTVAHVSKKGKVSLPADPRVSEGLIPHVHVSVIGHPEVVADLDVPVRYDVAFAGHFPGRAGLDGRNGFDGMAGSSGSSGSSDPNNPSAGGSGGNGTDGENGTDGDSGQPGQSVQVWITLRAGSQPLLQVRAASKDLQQLFLIDPKGGSLLIDANGGAGGSGGRGGRGGPGGSGGSGSPPGFNGTSGQDGRNGWDGAPGAAGKIQVSIDPSAQAYLDHFTFANKSGNGIAGAPPVITVAPMSALW